MAQQQARTPGQTTHNAVVSLLLPCLLIGNFLWSVLTPAHEYPMRSEQMLTMALDFLGLVGVIALRVSIPNPLFWCALVAGIGLFALRLNGDAGWWTGHLVYSLSPR
jgi:hypothetical protein